MARRSAQKRAQEKEERKQVGQQGCKTFLQKSRQGDERDERDEREKG